MTWSMNSKELNAFVTLDEELVYLIPRQFAELLCVVLLRDCNQCITRGPFLLKWINFNPNMDMYSYVQLSGWSNYIYISLIFIVAVQTYIIIEVETRAQCHMVPISILWYR